MPQGNKRSNSKNSKDWQTFEFVEIRLSEQDKSNFKSIYEKEPNTLLGEADLLCKNGYKLSVAYDTQNSCVIASLTCREPKDPNFNYVLSARAADYWEATALVLFKHVHLSDNGDWGGDTKSDARVWG